MGRQARLAALKDVLAEQQRSQMALADQLLTDPADEVLNRERRRLQRRVEQTQIEIRFLTDRRALVDDYTQQQHEALEEASAARDTTSRSVFENRAAFCETVVNDTLIALQDVPDLDAASLQKIQSDLARAAREAKHTVDSINAAIGFANKALDALVMLVGVAAKVAAA
jgi:hypothetical protein